MLHRGFQERADKRHIRAIGDMRGAVFLLAENYRGADKRTLA
jgi:hypothetical protein